MSNVETLIPLIDLKQEIYNLMSPYFLLFEKCPACSGELVENDGEKVLNE